MRYRPEVELTPQQMLEEYLFNNDRPSPQWTQAAQQSLAEIQNNPITIPTGHKQSQIQSMARAAQIEFTPDQQALYFHLREVPSGLTDQRLMTEICLFTGDKPKAIAMIKQYTSIRMRN